jgi:hypothetical protein
MFVQEESPCCLRFALAALGGLNLRALRLNFDEQGGQRLRIERPCRIGGFVGCPLEMTLLEGEAPLGKIQEDFDRYCSRCSAWRPGTGSPRGLAITPRHCAALGCCRGAGVMRCCWGAWSQLRQTALFSQAWGPKHRQRMHVGHASSCAPRLYVCTPQRMAW